MWQTAADIWRAVKQLPNSEAVRWLQLLASALIVATAAWQVIARSWRWLRGDKAVEDDDDEPPEGA